MTDALPARRRRRVAVFCGSASGNDPAYALAASQIGAGLARREVELVYGGGNVGLMKVVADAVIGGGGKVIGVIPGALVVRELAHAGLQELRVVDTMHERKALMADLADAFLALPGGFGTLDELFEIVTWAQLGIHRKPIALLDVGGFFAPLTELVDSMVRAGFVRPEHKSVIHVAKDPEAALEHLLAHEPPEPAVRWATGRER